MKTSMDTIQIQTHGDMSSSHSVSGYKKEKKKKKERETGDVLTTASPWEKWQLLKETSQNTGQAQGLCTKINWIYFVDLDLYLPI